MARTLDGEEPEQELHELRQFVERAVADLQQQACELSLQQLKSFFLASTGADLCEQTAFPSLVLDFLANMRVVAMKEELAAMVRQGDQPLEVRESHPNSPVVTVGGEVGVFASLAPALEVLMECVVAIASNGSLMETYRCELPNLIALTAEEYPPAATFIRDGCSRALMSVPDDNFNAGIAWYLSDCKAIAKTVELMTNYTLATTTSVDTAVRALEMYTSISTGRYLYGTSVTGTDNLAAAAAAAAVSEALGLTRSAGGSIDRGNTSTPVASSSKEFQCDQDAEATSQIETFCLSSYNVQFGIKSVLYVLERTFRFTLVLLDEFQMSGGYTLLLRLLDTCTEEEIPGFLDMLTLLIPLGARSAEAVDDTERNAANMFGARNTHAFSAMRDLLLNYVASQDSTGLGTDVDARNEYLVLQLLTHILHVYTSDYDNFVFLEPKTRTLALVLMKLPFITFYDAQVIILRIVEYVCCAADPEDPLAHEILSIVCGLLVAYSPLRSLSNFEGTYATDDANSGPSPAVSPYESLLNVLRKGSSLTLPSLMCECLIKILRDCEYKVYKEKLSGFGLMDRGVYVWLDQIATCLNGVPPDEISTFHGLLTDLKPHLEMYGKMLCLMIRNNLQECLRFREVRAQESLYAITDAMVRGDVLTTPFDVTEEGHLSGVHFSVMDTFTELAGALHTNARHDIDTLDRSSLSLLQVGVESDLSHILESLQRFRGAVWRQVLLLCILVEMLGAGGLAISPLWKACQGYEILVALLSSVDFASGDTCGHPFQIMELVLKVVSVTLASQHGGDYNTEYFRSIHGYSTVANCIITSGVLATAKRQVALRRVFDLISGDSLHSSIRNGDAVQIIFRLLPMIPSEESVNAMNKLLGMVEPAEDASLLSKSEQAVRVVRAGVFQWMCHPDILSRLMKPDDPLYSSLTTWIVTVTLAEEHCVPHLHDFFRLVGNTMPALLRDQTFLAVDSTREEPETGLLLLRDVLRSPAIRHVSVGKPQGVGQTGRYVHIVNSADRVWPPSSGYSFSCWLQFPGLALSNDQLSKDSKTPEFMRSVVPVALCEGNIRVARDGDDAGAMDVYGVLVDTILSLFPSRESAAQNLDPIDVLSINIVTRIGQQEWSFRSNSDIFQVSCPDDKSVAMWLRAMEQSGNLSSTTGTTSDDSLLTSFGTLSTDNEAEPNDSNIILRSQEEGSACIVSIYSLESSGCFVRVFFEHSTGYLRFHTGSASTGPSINANPKRTSVVFDTLSINDLRPAISTKTTNPNARVGATKHQVERKRDWHHFAFTHRKAVVGSSLITVYLDGQEVATKKLNFPSASSTGSFQAFVGSDAQVCSPHSALSWKVGPSWLLDEALSSGTVASMFSLGPTFTYQFSGHCYRSVGDWPEALASSHLTRAADRGIEIAEFAQRLQLTKLAQACQRKWSEFQHNPIASNDAATVGAASIAESMIAKREEIAEGLRLAAGGSVASRKETNKIPAFRNFISYGCDPGSFGAEIQTLLGNCKLSEDTVLFALNTSCGDRSNTPILAHTQVHYINSAQSRRLDLARSLPALGGICQVVFPLLDNARRKCDFSLVFRMLVEVLRRNPSCLAECIESSGYTFISAILCARVDFIDEKMLTSIVRLAVAGKLVPYAIHQIGTPASKQLAHPAVVDASALAQIILSVELRKKLPHHLQCQLVSLLMDLLVGTNPNALFNARQVRRAGLFQWILTYLADLSNEDCQMDQTTALEMRWCFPKFTEPTFEAILQYVLSLLRAFLRMESHVDDFHGIAEMVILSMTSTVMLVRESPIRVILLQFILHEIENDARNSETNAELTNTTEASQRLSCRIVEAILYFDRTLPVVKKREDKRVENRSNQEVVSPSATGDTLSKVEKQVPSLYPVDGFANVLLEVIDQDTENGGWVSAEALLAIRILLSLAQDHAVFAEHLLCQTVLSSKLRRVLRRYCINYCAYSPLLAFASSIPIGDSSYYDPNSFTIPTPPSTMTSSSKYADQVWDIVGDLLLRNCRDINSTVAREISAVVLGKIAYQVETSRSFFVAVCNSSGTIFKFVVQCMLCCRDDIVGISEQGTALRSHLETIFLRLTNSAMAEMNDGAPVVDACLYLIRVVMVRALYESDDFGALMMLFLEYIDEIIAKQGVDTLSHASGQRCWLELLKLIIKQEHVLKSKITLVSLRNLCTLCVAVSRYLADPNNHQIKVAIHPASTEGEPIIYASTTPTTELKNNCIGKEILEFLLDCCEMYSQPIVVQTIGVDEQQFFYGLLIYCAQTVVLNELGGAHRIINPSTQLLEVMLQSKEVYLQQPNWEGELECGISSYPSTSEVSGATDSNAPIPPGGRPRRMQRIRSLSANAHKEFCVGAESDRTFIFSLAAFLFRMLMSDSNAIRHTAIVLWQFLIDRRFDVLKELLIAEPRTSLLHTMTSTKKEVAVDVFHGGFDRLLYALHTSDAAVNSPIAESGNPEPSINQEIWCQFQLWLAENEALLADLILTRTSAIYRHGQEVLQSCVCIRNKLGGAGARQLTLDIDFPIRIDVRSSEALGNLNEENDQDRRDFVAQKALLKYSSFRDSALEAMNDGLARWRNISMQLANTRNIWHTGKWQNIEIDDHQTDSDIETLQSVFQRRALGYYLDTAEGPQRMRMRLVRDYTLEKTKLLTQSEADVARQNEDEMNPAAIDEVPHPTGPQHANFENEPFRRSLEFHDAVEVFREFVYRQMADGDHARSKVPKLQTILFQCKMPSTQDIFAGISEVSTANGESTSGTVIAIARQVYTYFLSGEETTGGRRVLGVSQSLIADIGRLIGKATEKPNEFTLPSSLFDAADVEATHYALYVVQHTHLPALMDVSTENSMDPERGGSDDEVEEEALVSSAIPVNEAQSDDSDEEIDVKNSGDIPATHDNLSQGETELLSTPTLPTAEPTSSKTDLGQIGKQVDTSNDTIYGSIARFLRRDDYPPMKSYNAAYVAGMGRTPGLFVICRFGLYFIGGHMKIYNCLASGTATATERESAKATTMSTFSSGESIPLEQRYQKSNLTGAPTVERRKTTKTRIRAALTELGVPFGQPKPGGEQFFTVAPISNLTIQPGLSASELPSLFTSSTTATSRWSIKYSNVKQFCRIKYQLRPVGIEFFDTSGSTYFLQLETAADREEIVKILFQMPLVNSIFWSPVLRTGALAPSIKRIRQAVTKRWLRGAISNFEYLIHLNTLAGRSFNDITQYPVFPWVIADYTSDFLDLEARDTFRDLSKPMGAVGESRAAQFRERFMALTQDTDTDGPMGTPAFHYGTHYSCSAYVINYLIRLEPFTALALELQGGAFDHPDRLFRSIPSSWASASRENLQDVRELIPEFFYLPEFLYNANMCKFGTTQSGDEVCHVILPPWAHGDPREFIRLNRRALESKYVSEHLHEWIDLVFGVKQTGQAAVGAQNVFMHFTYEGTVDIDQIADPVMRVAMLAQIENFGQTPSRLFSSPHPQRKVPTLSPSPSPNLSTSDGSAAMNPSAGHQYDGITLSAIEAYVKWHTPLAPALVSIGKEYVFLKKHSTQAVQVNGSAVGDVRFAHEKMQCQGVGCTFMPPRFAKYLDWGNDAGVMKLRVHQHMSGASRYRESNKALAVIEGAHQGCTNCAAFSDDGVFLVTGGQDAVVNLIECSKGSDGRRIFRQIAKFIGHSGAVLCVAINKVNC
ncbi:unnamed protein product [Phytophthora fragariaefolia]|uniref:Unnamed protein product n=1 Tax=Phytophthora fragariaefolia TaxID=1490495 RepID=A0A9W7CQS5_9STRA|nr:unnamed protein product [Phytophthora fragariaefolia]